MARVYEYQGKEALKEVGIAVPQSGCVETPEDAVKLARQIGKEVVLKAQVWATGRFKAGGIKFAKTPEEAGEQAKQLLGAKIKGLEVNKILVEEKIDIEKELYAGIIISDSIKVKGAVLIVSSEGGVDLEEVAAESPEKVVKMNIDYADGINAEEAKKLLATLPIDQKYLDELADIIYKLFKAFKAYDATALEINPLVITKDKQLFAADCRLTIDDNSAFKHPEFGIKVPRDMDRPATKLEEIAWDMIEEGDYRGTGYFMQMVPTYEGRSWIGFQGIGGGGAMLGASAFINRGFKIANYADTSGDPTASKVYMVIKSIFSLPIDAYVLMGSCLANQEQWHHAHAVVKALREEAKDRPGLPVILLLAGNKEKESHEIIQNGLKGLPLRWELYGRDYIYNTDYIADRVEDLVRQYQLEKYGE